MERHAACIEVENIPIRTIEGGNSDLRDYAGKVRLVVNVASKCGLTPQYEGLEALYRRFRDQGFVVLGFPSNDFREQEPGSDAEIAEFCKLTYAVDFPMFAKVRVSGEGKHPLYGALTLAQPHAASTTGGAMRERLTGYGISVLPEPEILWNFEKFLVGRSGDVVGRFAPDMSPDDPFLIGAIEHELNKTG
jgi:glutathione peroxidase